MVSRVRKGESVKIEVKKDKLRLTLTPTDIRALGEILNVAHGENRRAPISWLTRSKVTRKIFNEMAGAVEGLNFGLPPICCEDVELSEDYQRARDLVKKGDPHQTFTASGQKPRRAIKPVVGL